MLDLSLAIEKDQTLLRYHGDTYGLTLSHLSRYADAIEVYERTLQEVSDSNRYYVLYNIAVVIVCWKGNKKASDRIREARVELLRLLDTKEEGYAFYGIDGLEAILGNVSLSLNYLSKAVKEKKHVAIWARHDIAWRHLHGSAPGSGGERS